MPTVDLKRLVEVSPGVYVAQSRRYVTRSTVVLDGRGGALVVDPAWDADELAAIPADLAGMGVRCVAGLATHVHYDHILWHHDLGSVPRWASPGTVAMVAGDRNAVIAPLVGDIPDDLVELAGRLTPIGGQELSWSGPIAQIHLHHAHAPHHLALELPELGVLLAGDMLSDVELPMPDSGDKDLIGYREGLDSLAEVVGRSSVLIPGHGSVSMNPMERLDADRRYLDDLAERGASDDPRIAMPDMAELHAENLARAQARI